MDKGLWEESKQEDADEEDMGSCYRSQRRIYAKKKESIFLVQKKEGRNERIYLGADEKGIYKAIKITTDGTSILCRKER